MSELAKALCKAQAKVTGAKKDKDNPFFNSRYADLASTWDACRDALTENGFTVLQFGRIHETLGMVLVTRLLHTSGDSIDGEIPILNGKGDMQGLGSALTYARRYGLAAMVGVCPEDDDGNAASQPAKPAAAIMAVPAGYEQWRNDFIACADEGLKAMAAAWVKSAPAHRDYWTTREPAEHRAQLKARAKVVDARAAEEAHA